ncbi:MAG TPA: hypothetical protein VMZ02_10905 [Candidatus Limnocylindrales bacterium]|jgi:ABC-type lipoprotein release transport system permease subunit|nr:hypothetical protein [Candidatus Limnocylindrales bacterium]
MLKKSGGLIFFFIMIIAGLGIANFLSMTFYEKSLLTAIKDFVFVVTKR